MCVHMKLHLDSHGVKKPSWKGRFSPLALATHSSSRFIFFWHPPFSTEPRIWHGCWACISAVCTHDSGSQQQTYGKHHQRAFQTFYRWKSTKRPYADGLPATYFWSWHFVWLNLWYFQLSSFPFQNDFSYMLFSKPNWKRKKRRKIWLHNYCSKLPWCSNHLEQKLAYLGILCNISQWAVLGTCFPQISPSVTAFLESDDLKAIILYLGYQQMEKSGK